jgi:uncharacterized protein with HEPN domain
MPPHKGDAARLYDMLQAAETIVRYVSSKTREDFEREELLRDAVERRVEIIGEAARGISRVFRDAHPEVPWPRIMATRHILAHDYGDVNHDIVWSIATVHVPELITLLKPLIPPPPPDPEPET